MRKLSPHNVMRFIMILFTLMGLTIIVVACQYKKDTPTEKSRVETEMLYRWISGQSCSPVCWEGIIPGTTTRTEAMSILEKNELVKEVHTFNYDELNFGEIGWDWNDESERGGRLFYRPLGNESASIVYSISPSIACCAKLKEVVEIYQDPEYIRIMESDGEYNYTLFWIKKGFFVSGGPSNETQIDGDFLIYSIVFFQPSMDGLVLSEGNIEPRLVAWHGYDDRSTYLLGK